MNAAQDQDRIPADSFYVEEAPGLFVSTELTRGPWGPGAQHAGPPSALLGRAIELDGDAGKQVARVTFEILKPVPVAPLRASTEVLRPGRNVQLVSASLRAGEDEVMRAHAWLMRTEPLELSLPEPAPPPDSPGSAAPASFLPTGYSPNYMEAMEWRFPQGSPLEPGPAVAWIRMRHPLVAGEPSSPLVHVLAAADSASGISNLLDWRRWLFVNCDLSVYLHRMPAGEWVRLDAVTVIQADGIGMATSVISDEQGPIGRSVQSLLIAPR